MRNLSKQFVRLRNITSGIALVGEVSERVRARVMAQGELMATRLGADFLAAQGLDVKWIEHAPFSKPRSAKMPFTRELFIGTCNFERTANCSRTG